MKTLDDIFASDLVEVANGIKNGEVSPVELVNGLLDRIKKVDLKLNSFITINRKEALDIAAEREKEIKLGEYRGPLHGVPIGIKDIIDTKGLKTTAGSQIYENNIPNEDAPVVKHFKSAGAIIIGKLSTHQFAYGPTGDRSYFGPVANPHNITKMTGGSSGGSAAAVSACLCYGALGTDTGGSIRIPSSFCGIVGMKPTYGSVSKRGVYPLSWGLDHVGPMTRSISANAVLLNVISTCDKEDPDSIYREPEDFTRLIGQDINNITIGIPTSFFFDNLNQEIKQLMQKTIERFENLGASTIPVDLPNMERMTEAHKVILRSDAYAIHEKNLIDYPDYWDEEVKERLLTALDTKGFEYANAIRMQQLAKKEFEQALEKIDVLLTPTMSVLPPEINGRHVGNAKNEEQHIRWTITKLTSPTNLSGSPSLSLPCGYSSGGMPVGVQLIGKEYEEAKLYQIGYVLEQDLSLKVAKLNIE